MRVFLISLIFPVYIEKVVARIAISAITGIIVNTKEKASCPGNMDITGFLIILKIGVKISFIIPI